jgi:MoaA/NifB/PqqE/SkfB family radical SAM enzyme
MDKFPEIITFRITSSCSQNCCYCYGPKNIPGLNFEKLKEIFKLFAQRGVKGVVLTGGEPLIRDDIKKIFKELKRYKFKIFLDTNGDLFFKYKNSINRFVNVLGLPLDSASRVKSYRDKNNFDQILKILEYYKNFKKRPKIKIGTVVTKENVEELPKIADLLKKYSIDTWKIYQFIPIGQVAIQNKKDLLVETQLFLKQANKIRHEYNQFFEIIISSREERSDAYFLMNPDGTIIMPSDKKIKCEEIIIGNIFDKDIVEKWQKFVLERNYLDNAKITYSHKWENYPMRPIYNQIWQIAKRYNQKGQFYTSDHIEWHIKEALTIIKNEKIDETIFIPFIILHDVGYSKAHKESPFKEKVRKIHMEAGKEIAKKILQAANYPKDKTEKISFYVSLHDNWAFGDNKIYQENKILGIFNDLDYISMFSRECFPAMAKFLKKNPINLLNYLENDEKLKNRPFLVRATEKLYDKYLSYKKFELFQNNEL